MLLDVGRNMHRLDVSQRQPPPLTPAEERPQRPHIGHPRVLVSDVGGEELNEAPTRALAGVGDKGW